MVNPLQFKFWNLTPEFLFLFRKFHYIPSANNSSCLQTGFPYPFNTSSSHLILHASSGMYNPSHATLTIWETLPCYYVFTPKFPVMKKGYFFKLPLNLISKTWSSVKEKWLYVKCLCNQIATKKYDVREWIFMCGNLVIIFGFVIFRYGEIMTWTIFQN